jgi:hypothetical protein
VTTIPAPPVPAGHPSIAARAEHVVQRVADASVWLIFRLDRVRS